MLRTSKPSSGRIAATGGMLAARRAGMMTDSMVMPTPTTKANRIVRGSSTVSLSGKPSPAALNRPMISLGDADAAADAEHGGDDRHHQRFEVDQPPHLAAGGADGPHQRQLPQPLADRDLRRRC